MDFSFVHIIGFGYNMTPQVTFPILVPENIFHLECFVCKASCNITETWGFVMKL
jgi:hypothetical protein